LQTNFEGFAVMVFKATDLKGVFIIEPEIIEDERGFFARSGSPKDFVEQGLNPGLVHSNFSFK
jgi:dTDP-4-dehydrorhamnose 3,5-epimerase